MSGHDGGQWSMLLSHSWNESAAGMLALFFICADSGTWSGTMLQEVDAWMMRVASGHFVELMDGFMPNLGAVKMQHG